MSATQTQDLVETVRSANARVRAALAGEPFPTHPVPPKAGTWFDGFQAALAAGGAR